jgi:transcription antitermination factor NusG
VEVLNDNPWYALRVRSNCEKTVALSLGGKGYAEFLPLYRKLSRRRGPAKQIESPLFPGYVFSAFDVNHRLPILMTPGVVHVVGIGRIPEAVDKDELLAIERFVSSGLAVEPWPFLKKGEPVLVERGPLSGLEGVLIEIKGLHRLVISLSLLQRSVAVEIDRDCVRPLKRSTIIALQAPHHAVARVA